MTCVSGINTCKMSLAIITIIISLTGGGGSFTVTSTLWQVMLPIDQLFSHTWRCFPLSHSKPLPPFCFSLFLFNTDFNLSIGKTSSQHDLFIRSVCFSACYRWTWSNAMMQLLCFALGIKSTSNLFSKV